VTSLSERPGNAPKEHNSVKVQKNPDYELKKEQILSGIGEDPG